HNWLRPVFSGWLAGGLEGQLRELSSHFRAIADGEAKEEARNLSQKIADLQSRLAELARMPTPTPTPTSISTPTPLPTTTPSPTPVPSPTPTQAPAPTPPPTDDALVSAQKAVVLVKSSAGLGSGFVFNPNGLVLTNAHIVGDDPWVVVVTTDAVPLMGDVIGRHLPLDVAVIQLRTEDPVAALALGNSGPMEIGSRVNFLGYPVGAPLGVPASIAGGDLYSRRQLDEVEYLQIDASLSPGISGGPLVDSQGRAVGIHTATLFQTGTISARGVGFAIAIDPIKEALPNLSTGINTLNPRSTDTNSAWTLYQNFHWGYAMQLAPGWTADKTHLDDLLLWSDDHSRGGELLSQRATGYTVDVWLQTVLNAMRYRATDFQELSRTSKLTGYGFPSMSVLYTATFPWYEEPVKVRLLAVVAGDRNFALQLHAQESDWDSYGPDLDAMASTFSATP
ncbi:MAG: S1C family serine protease, partial [Dehalococcoidia bacterium]|nr:S1C family serine protease [Dehalococcoidia bacterium]